MLLPPSLVTSTWAHRWLSAHAGQRALARPLVVLVGAASGVREGDVSAQGRRVFANWRRLARIATDEPARPIGALLAMLLSAPMGGPLESPFAGDDDVGDAFDLVAFDDAATRVRVAAGELPALGQAHHVLLLNPRRVGRGGARGALGANSGAGCAIDRWLAADGREPRLVPQLFPSRPGRPGASPGTLTRDAARPPRVRTVCSVRPARADAACVSVVSRWRDEALEAAAPPAPSRARWNRMHTAIALATVFAQLAEVEAGSPAVFRT